MMYVLFRDDPQNHYRVLYIARDKSNNQLVQTPDRIQAIEFDTAAEGYQFGEDNELGSWKVGIR